MKNKIINFFLLFFIVFNTYSLSGFSTFPIWSELDSTEVSAEVNAESFFNIESESAILIEQNSRRNSL